MLKKIVILFILLSVFSCTPKVSRDVKNLTFDKITQLASGTEVRFYMWGGSEQINNWIDNYVGVKLKQEYNLDLVRVPMDASIFVNKLLIEKSAGKKYGDIDLLWINGENFKNAKIGGVLYGPYIDLIPNYKKYIDPKTALSDSGFPVNGYELPYGKAQFNYIYNADNTLLPPNNFMELKKWVVNNPGLFSYPSPPDFTGSAFIRQAFYALTGGYEQYQSGFNQELFDSKSKILWDYLNDLEPNLWNSGKTYPRDLGALDKLFEKGEVSFTMSFTQTMAQNRINEGIYPSSVKSHIFSDGSLGNTHFTAIPFNAPNIPGALVLSNFLIDPQTQLSKNSTENWGDFTVLSIGLLDEKYKMLFNELELGDATLPLSKLDENVVPEIPSDYLEALERGWEQYVLRK